MQPTDEPQISLFYLVMALVHTVFPGFIPEGYFANDNIEFIRDKVRRELAQEYRQNVIVDRASVIRIMQRILEERVETIPRMNQRSIMTICADVRRHQDEIHRNLKWEAHYIDSQKLYDASVERGPDIYNIKLANRLGKPRVGGTMRFYFT